MCHHSDWLLAHPGSFVASCDRVSYTVSSSNFQTLYVFDKNGGGIVPVGALLALRGTLYGTTNFGGHASKDCYPARDAEPFSRSTRPARRASFTASPATTSGTRPYAGMIDLSGTLYGTTQTGGKHNEGTVFALTTAGPEHVIWSFKGKDGNFPRASLTSVNGALYGTTYYGGSAETGTVFTVTTSGAEQVLHSFTGGKDGVAAALHPDRRATTCSTARPLRAARANTEPSSRSVQTGTNYSVLYSFQAARPTALIPMRG